MAAALYHQIPRNKRDLMINGNSQPEVVVLANRKGLIEPANLLEQGLLHHDGRWAHETKLKASPENIAGGVGMFRFWIDPAAVTNPDLISLANT